MKKLSVVLLLLAMSLVVRADVTSYVQFVDPSAGDPTVPDDYVAYGYVYGDSYIYSGVTCKDLPHPPIYTFIDGTTVTGSVSGLSGFVNGVVVHSAGAGVIQHADVKFTVLYNYGPIKCGGYQLVSWHEAIDAEIASVRLINVQGSGTCGPFTFGSRTITTCEWNVLSYCSNVPITSFPDFNPPLATDGQALPQPWGFDATGVCVRAPLVSRKWTCRGWTHGKILTNPGPSASCTYNP